MSIAGPDLEKRVLHRHIFNGDDVVKGVKRLDRSEARYHGASIDRMGKQIAMFGKVAVGVAGIGAAWKTAGASLNSYLRNSQLAIAAGSADIDRLSEAFGGLIERTEVMQFAADASRSSFVATQKEMEIAARFTKLLASRGQDLTKSFREVTKAIVEGNAEGLKQLGVNIKTQSDTVQGFTDIVGEMERQLKRSGGASTIAGEEIVRANVSMKNSIDDLKSAFGELVSALGPGIDLLSKAFSGLATALDDPLSVAESIGEKLSFGYLFGSRSIFDANAYRKNLEAIQRARLAIRGSRAEQRAYEETLRKQDREFDAFGRRLAAARAAMDRKMRGPLKGRGGGRRSELDFEFGGTGGVGTVPFAGADILPPGSAETPRVGFDIPSVTGGQFGGLGFGGFGAGDISEATGLNAAFGTDPNTLTGGFGVLFELLDKRSPLEKFLGDIPGLAKTGEQALAGFGSVLNKTFMAVMTGSEGALKAFKKFMGQQILTQAAGMWATAGTETVKGLASLALGPLGGVSAAGHFKAAGAAAIQAGALTAMAAGMGATGGAQRGAGTSVGGGLGGGAGIDAGDSGRTTNIFAGDDFMSGRERAQRYSQYIAIGDREGDRSTVTFD